MKKKIKKTMDTLTNATIKVTLGIAIMSIIITAVLMIVALADIILKIIYNIN